MQIKQWEDKNLAQYSYGVVSDCKKEMVLIDPARNPHPYLQFAKENDLTITAIIETHPHADFVSSHLEIRQLTGAAIYVSQLVEAEYEHKTFDEVDSITFGNIRLTALNTPGHSPDSISLVLYHQDQPKALFSGDTLFIGDCGRPDLRESGGNAGCARHDLAKQMYASLREKMIPLPDEVTLYPGHGAGTLCGKNLSKESSSTLGKEKKTNWSLQEMTEEEFVTSLLSDQPFIPAYFPFDVALNKKGAPSFDDSIEAVTIRPEISLEEEARQLDAHVWIIDARNEADFKKSHLPHSINLMDGAKFDTWLGSIIKPHEAFYLAAESTGQLRKLIERTAAIGYEQQVKESFVLSYGNASQHSLDIERFEKHIDEYTIIDVRNASETKESKPFKNSLHIPLAEIRNRIQEIPTHKPVVVHCAGGYRSAAASSLIDSALAGVTPVLDLGDHVKKFL